MKEQANRAYDLSLFETAPELEKKKQQRKKNNMIVLPDGSVNKEARRKHNRFYVAVISAFVVIFTAVSITIVQSNVLINELNTEIITAEEQLNLLEAQSTQYQVQIDSKLSAEKVESYAEDVLGMTKAENMDKEFITMSGEDKGEVLADDSNRNVFEIIADAFTSLWS